MFAFSLFWSDDVWFLATLFSANQFAAITSAISLTEPAISYLVEKYNASRARVAISLGVFVRCLVLERFYLLTYGQR